MASFSKSLGIVSSIAITIALSGCMSKGLEMTDQQQRMARCDQYIEMARDQCLRGDNVTIDDYNEEYKDFEKDLREKQAKLEEDEKANEKLKAEKLKQALDNAKAEADKVRKAELEKKLKAIEDGKQ